MKRKYIFLIIIVVFAVLIAVQSDKTEKQDLLDQVNPEEVSELPVSESSPVVPVERITLAAIEPYEGTGEANRSFDSVFSHGVVLDVADPAADKFYEGWLVQKPSTPIKFYSTGALEKNENGQYVLMYEAPINEEAYYNEVVITEETLADGLDGKPEAHVFEGRFES